MVVGIHKGNQFELLIYKDLRGLGECKRTIGSGSSDEPADILFKDYAIECKHLKEVNWKTLTRFWNKLLKQCNDYARDVKPIIVYRENRKPIMVMCIVSIGDCSFRAITSYNIWRQVVLK